MKPLGKTIFWSGIDLNNIGLDLYRRAGHSRVASLALRRRQNHIKCKKKKADNRPPQLVEKAIFDFYASCGSTHSIEFALQIHKFREHGPDHPLLPLCGNSPCVSRNLYKGRKNVSAGRGFSSRFARKRGFEREAARKTIVFRQPQRHTFQCASFHFPQIFFLQALTGYHAHPRQISSSMTGVICVSIARIRS